MTATARSVAPAPPVPPERFLSISRAIGAPVWGRADELIGHLADAVARVLEPGAERFPPLTGLVVRVGGWRGHNVFVPWEAVRVLSAAGVGVPTFSPIGSPVSPAQPGACPPPRRAGAPS